MSSSHNFPDQIQSSSDLDWLGSMAQVRKQKYKSSEIVWRVWGNGTPIILMHGGSGSWNHWCRNIKSLSDMQRQIWIPDIPCFGDSDAPDEVLDIDQAAEVLLLGIQEFFPGGKLDLIGFSMGSMGAGYIAHCAPERIGRLILTAPPALGISPKESIVIEDWTKGSSEAEKDQMIKNNLTSLMLANSSSITDLSLQIHKSNLLKDRMRKRKIYKTNFLMRIMESLEISFDCILGGKDALYQGSLTEVTQTLKNLARLQSLNVIENAGHWVQFERPAEYNSIIKTILK